jgi:hypothetical protein
MGNNKRSFLSGADRRYAATGDDAGGGEKPRCAKTIEPMTKTLSTILINKEQMIATVVGWIDKIAALLTSEVGRLRMRQDIRMRPQLGTIEVMKVIAAAEAGHQDADIALRQLGVEMLDRGEMRRCATTCNAPWSRRSSITRRGQMSRIPGPGTLPSRSWSIWRSAAGA